ncbi:Oidioi.mRNA.OKI2018_I69.chr1.g1657.t1.cds [Oikopleura dioica]|uniref:Oidioi.mRNA.OKI2018_I69.chr1.g1657.t1.cds n=1 Tax=Oikopleura dioica TaxID=34765 RepID=A0ABN7SVK0_OIKDI|nr:Oidioi.mRNA.OKI2018_I69.chr1.g1657.t1.cds [Oikopleura dioica]
MSEAASEAVNRNIEETEKQTVDWSERVLPSGSEPPFEGAEPSSSRAENDDDNASESDWKPQRSGAFHALVQMLRDGGDPYQLARMIGLDFSRDENPMRVIQHLLAAFAEEKRERQRKLSLEEIVELIQKSKNIMILTGAGISVSCGIPDFRSKNGLYAKLAVDFPELPDPQSMFCLQFFKGDQRPFFRFAKEIYPGSFQPSPSHKFIAELEKRGKLLRNFTQNIDGLEQEAGIQNVIQCHGHFHTATCLDPNCKARYKSSDIKEEIFAQRIPRCKKLRTKKRLIPRPKEKSEIPTVLTKEESFETYEDECGSVIKPDIVFFGESLPKHFHKAMVDEKDKADLLIVMGSSLKVGPVNEIPDALDSSVPAILINRESLRYASEFDGELLGNCDDIVAVLANKLGWSDFGGSGGAAEVSEVTREELEKISKEEDKEENKEFEEGVPPEKRRKIEENSAENDKDEAKPVVSHQSRRPRVEVPKGVFCQLESGYQTVFHGHELLPDGYESSSSEESDEENEEEEDGFNGYEDIPESERKKDTENQENGEAISGPSGGNVIATEEKLKEEIAEESEEKREQPL